MVKRCNFRSEMAADSFLSLIVIRQTTNDLKSDLVKFTFFVCKHIGTYLSTCEAKNGGRVGLGFSQLWEVEAQIPDYYSRFQLRSARTNKEITADHQETTTKILSLTFSIQTTEGFWEIWGTWQVCIGNEYDAVHLQALRHSVWTSIENSRWDTQTDQTDAQTDQTDAQTDQTAAQTDQTAGRLCTDLTQEYVYSYHR